MDDKEKMDRMAKVIDEIGTLLEENRIDTAGALKIGMSFFVSGAIQSEISLTEWNVLSEFMKEVIFNES